MDIEDRPNDRLSIKLPSPNFEPSYRPLETQERVLKAFKAALRSTIETMVRLNPTRVDFAEKLER